MYVSWGYGFWLTISFVFFLIQSGYAYYKWNLFTGEPNGKKLPNFLPITSQKVFWTFHKIHDGHSIDILETMHVRKEILLHYVSHF